MGHEPVLSFRNPREPLVGGWSHPLPLCARR
jgi:hypothetical protein